MDEVKKETVGFTGHRDLLARPQELAAVHADHPGAVWVHGGAIGFDTQVSGFAKANGIEEIVIRPDYASYGKSAPLVRNEEIVRRSDILYALWDGRTHGCNYYTMELARESGKAAIELLLAGSEKEKEKEKEKE